MTPSDCDEQDVHSDGDEWGMFVQHDEVPSALPPEFTPSVAFRGARPGAVFTCGPLGLGYQRDVPLAERAPLRLGLGVANVGRQPAVIL